MDIIGGKYRVLKTLGKGAMGEVYLVLPPRGDPVALKMLQTDEKNQGAAVTQFENEFKVLKKLSHPNIGEIFDYGFDTNEKKIYFTSPWLKGTDLFTATKELSYEKCEEYFIQLLRALHYLHGKGIIHCDLKPGNVFVEGDHVRLIDFGLAGYWGSSIVGTPTYLAPEIFKGSRHSVSSDLYAVGVVIYNCLARTQPFSGKNVQEIYDRHRTHTPALLSDVKPALPKYISDITAALLAKKGEERYASPAAVIEEIAAFSGKKYSVETEETLLSYLPKTSELVGRGEAQEGLQKQIQLFLSGQSPFVGLFIHGENGAGKSKFVSQVRTSLQLGKIPVEDAVLPLTETDKKLLGEAKAIILEDADNYLGKEAKGRALQEFLSFLEQKILQPETSRLFLVVTGTAPEHWSSFAAVIPDEFSSEKIHLPPLSEEETRQFLELIIGQTAIPQNFISEIHRNTGGNPGVCEQIIQNLIQQGLLFDEGGRWSADLLPHLENSLNKLKAPGSLEERLVREYNTLSGEEEEVMTWLAMAPHGLDLKTLAGLTHIPEMSPLLKTMEEKKIVRMEGDLFFLYRSAFVPFIRKTLPAAEQQKRHTRLADRVWELKLAQVWYHESHGVDPVLARISLEKLAAHLEKEGRKEGALECFERLIAECRLASPSDRLHWHVAASELLIWCDRFEDAVRLLDERLVAFKGIPLESRLVFWEKKGLALLHQQKVASAREIFEKGLSLAAEQGAAVEKIRFLNDLAEIEALTGHLDSAITKFKETRKEASHVKEGREKITNNDLGHVYYRMGNYDRAIDLLKEDISTFTPLPAKEPLARAQYTLSEALRAQKKYPKAMKEYETCAALAQKNNLLPILLRTYNGMGNIQLMEERYEEALA
ncbi:MAG: protein kinase, partial [Deltaproteobacteria bacterium]|nr:protein kinase [Deltaproteobacteria bacterium]